jgi:hypothetical protein
MTRTALLVLALSTVALAAQAAPRNGGQPGSGNNPAGNGGFVSVTVTTSTTAVYMGMSDHLAPNARAAVSNGTRTEVTTSQQDINGPKGQVDAYVAGDSATCNNCTISAPYNPTTTITDLPGANR